MHRSPYGTLARLFLAASILFMLFVVLSGVKNTTPLNKTYFLRADTSNIEGARDVTQWTYFQVCGRKNLDCGKPVPALPLGYAWRGGGEGAPESLKHQKGNYGKGTTSKHFYFLWRFGWVFYLMGLALAGLALIIGIPCRVRMLKKLAGLVASFALFWFTLGVALMTAEFVQARNRFRSAGHSASLGRYAFGFSYAAWVCLFLAMIFFFLGGRKGHDDLGRMRKERRASRASTTHGGVPATSRGRFDYQFYKGRRHREAEEDGVIEKETA